MKVKDVMTKDIIVVDKDENLKHVLNLMKKNEITKIPVLEEKKLVGLVTDNIIAYKLGSIRKKGVPPSRLHASSVTDKNIECVHPETDVEKILEKVGEPGPTMLCVTENSKLLGVITKADLLPFVKSKKKVKELANKKIITVSTDDRVIHARRIMVDHNIARLPVLKDGKLVGIISDNEIAFALANLKSAIPLGRQKHRLEELLIENVMKKPVIWIQPNISAFEAANIMIKNNLGMLPLIENDKIIGIISRTDLLKTISL
jgi:CBS domain-containing protein